MAWKFNPHRRLGGLVLTVLVPLGVAGCAQPAPEPPPPVAVAPKPPPRPPAPRPLPTAQASAKETAFSPDESPANSNKTITGTSKTPDTQEATVPTPQQAPSLAGLSEGEVTRRFGKPATVRKTPSANIWTYQDQACTLDLFLFTDMRSGEQKVLTYQLGGTGRETLGERGCLERLGNNGKTG
jgi:hypothetical protein